MIRRAKCTPGDGGELTVVEHRPLLIGLTYSADDAVAGSKVCLAVLAPEDLFRIEVDVVREPHLVRWTMVTPAVDEPP